MGVLLLIFRKGIGTAAIEKLMAEFNGFKWVKAFTDNDRIYAMQVPGDQAGAWKDSLAQLPEIDLVEQVGTVRLVHDRAA